MPVPLPLNPFPPSSDEYAAYISCLNLEPLGSSWSRVVDEKESSRAAMFKFSPGVAARVLGYALIYSPSTKGKACLAEEISSCDGDNELLAGLSYLYIMAMIRIFKNPKGAIPTPTSVHSPRSSFQVTADDIAVLLSQPTASSSNAKKLALARDNYRCILSGNVDTNSSDTGLTTVNETERITDTQLGHIFGEFMSDCIVGMTDAAHKKACLSSPYIYISVVEELNQNKIHCAQNTFTVSPEFHGPFGRLRISLQPIGHEDSNTYQINTYPPNRHVMYGLPEQVTLMDASASGQIPLPSRRYFQLHDACAKISHLSGAGEVVEQLFRDVEDLRVLAEDGGSSDLLSLALLSRPMVQHD
ncbi:hypothetical protein ARMSODRAFT_1018811 [Armillaria solidipes]|uniref:HNH nuclease domain-containing protein n=1 Tax=Armillaria solidipes TaxID=1076256 RepID=A0A2H3C274_9AGAR|nr:hypothetical protein ARMSODRAFT_1018811 [Armillaria solidipes]